MTETDIRTEKVFFALGTVCRITVYGKKAAAAADAAKRRVMELHRRLNAYDPESEISAVNACAGIRPAEVSEDALRLIRSAVSWSEETGGLLDITTTPLSLLWKSAIANRALPRSGEVADRKALVGYRDILIEGKSVMLRKRGQRMDLGATAKGYAADEAARILKDAGAGDAVINFGGTVRVLGRARRVGIQDPFGRTGSSFASVTLTGRAAVTSGIYEQCLAAEGERYHHIVDPRTGYPSRSGLQAATLIGDSAEELDALATVSLITGPEKAAGLIRRSGAEAVFVRTDGEVYVTGGLRDVLEFKDRECS